MLERPVLSLLGRGMVWWFILVTVAMPVAARYGGGLGTAESPYLIFTASQLCEIGNEPQDWGSHFKLMADVDLQDRDSDGFHIIGTSTEEPFTGVFDGNHKTISNLRLVNEFGFYEGLFGFVAGEHARIENVTLMNPSVVGEIGRYVGALVGGMEGASVVNCHVWSGNVRAFSHIGGLIGRNDGGTISECTVWARVQGTSRVGGLVGQSYFGTFERCRTEVEVLAPQSSYWVGGLVGELRQATVRECRTRGTVSGDACVGGLVGESYIGAIERCCMAGGVSGTANVGGILGLNSGGFVDDCYTAAEVSAESCAGGAVGYNGPSCHCAVYQAGVVNRCYAAGPVSGGNAGGLVGVDDRGEVVNSFWNTEASGWTASAGGEGRTTSQMADASLYLTAGWDFVGEKVNGTWDVWYMPAVGDGPRLAWELVDGDFNADVQVNFRDFSLLAARWRQEDSMDAPDSGYSVPDGVVDLDDLARFVEVWLAGR